MPRKSYKTKRKVNRKNKKSKRRSVKTGGARTALGHPDCPKDCNQINPGKGDQACFEVGGNFSCEELQEDNQNLPPTEVLPQTEVSLPQPQSVIVTFNGSYFPNQNNLILSGTELPTTIQTINVNGRLFTATM